MLAIVRSNRFLKDLRLAKKRGFDLSSLEEVVNKLANQETLDPKYRDHPLNKYILVNDFERPLLRFLAIRLFFLQSSPLK